MEQRKRARIMARQAPRPWLDTLAVLCEAASEAAAAPATPSGAAAAWIGPPATITVDRAAATRSPAKPGAAAAAASWQLPAALLGAATPASSARAAAAGDQPFVEVPAALLACGPFTPESAGPRRLPTALRAYSPVRSPGPACDGGAAAGGAPSRGTPSPQQDAPRRRPLQLPMALRVGGYDDAPGEAVAAAAAATVAAAAAAAAEGASADAGGAAAGGGFAGWGGFARQSSGSSGCGLLAGAPPAPGGLAPRRTARVNRDLFTPLAAEPEGGWRCSGNAGLGAGFGGRLDGADDETGAYLTAARVASLGTELLMLGGGEAVEGCDEDGGGAGGSGGTDGAPANKRARSAGAADVSAPLWGGNGAFDGVMGGGGGIAQWHEGVLEPEDDPDWEQEPAGRHGIKR